MKLNGRIMGLIWTCKGPKRDQKRTEIDLEKMTENILKNIQAILDKQT